MTDLIQKRALETWHVNLPVKLQYQHALLGLIGESGEVADQYKKHIFKPGYRATREERLDELGDVLYYLAILAHLDGHTIDELSQLNYDKLTHNNDSHGWEPDYYGGL
jgi:NTP pyrophosphatase (non-canonical NTP hydrolase)